MRPLRVGLGLFMLLAAGCGPAGRPSVAGTVTRNGVPLGNLTLALFAEGNDGETFAQHLPILADGTFSGEVPAPGKYKVVFEESRAVQENRNATTKGLTAVPQKYWQKDTTDLSWDIQPGMNRQAFDLKQ